MKRLMMVFAMMSLAVMATQAQYIRQKSYMLSQTVSYTNMGPMESYPCGAFPGHLVSWLSENEIILADGSRWQLANRNGGCYHYRITKSPDIPMPGQQLQEVVITPDYSRFQLNYIFDPGIGFGGMQMASIYVFFGDGDSGFNQLSRECQNYNRMMR